MITVKNLFLIDGIGALVSAIMLGIVLPHFQSLVGMPMNELYILAAIPVVFVLFDLYCFRQRPTGQMLRVIALANLGYCVLSALFVAMNSQVLTTLGWFYFVVEILIILVLVTIEMKTALKASPY